MLLRSTFIIVCFNLAAFNVMVLEAQERSCLCSVHEVVSIFTKWYLSVYHLGM